MSERQARKLRKVVYQKDMSYRHRVYVINRITGQIKNAADSLRAVYQNLKKQFRNGKSL